MRRRVKITGLGPITPAGTGRADFFRGINESVSRVRAITRFDPAAGEFVGAEVTDFDLERYAPGEATKRMPRHTQFGLAAAILALQDAGLTPRDLRGKNPVIITGTTMMDCDSVSKTIEFVTRKGPRYGLVSSVTQALSVSIPDKISQYLETPSRIMALQTACCSGLDSIGHGAECVASGQADFVICGGAEAPLYYHPMLELGLAELSPKSAATPEKICRPFDLWRTTGVFGEGACMFVLEPEESPRPACAWVAGYGYANDHSDQIGSGWYESIRMALANARRTPDNIDYISAWGPGHREIDFKEAQSLKRIFGAALDGIPVSSIKGAVGSGMAAAGAIQIASAVLALQHGLIPPTVNWETPDPDCPLSLSNAPRRLGPAIALVNGHGISGSNSSLVLERA
ncbi:MAG TPA: beta-ketoacyl-[acyl-carrier-protein] synthase family protein [Lacunisphaera sp.]